MKTQLAALALVLASSGSALAGGQADAVGVGAESMLNGLAGGLSVN